MLEKTLWVPWTARRSNQSILKEISPEYSLEVLLLKLKLQYFGHLMQRADSFEKTLILGKIEGGRSGDDRGWDYWIISLTRWTWVWVNSGSLWWTGKPGMLQSMGSQGIRHDWATELNWVHPEAKVVWIKCVCDYLIPPWNSESLTLHSLVGKLEWHINCLWPTITVSSWPSHDIIGICIWINHWAMQ